MKHKLFYAIAALLFAMLPMTSGAQLSELSGKQVTVSFTPATTLATGQWYIMYNRGTDHGYLYESNGGLYNWSAVPDDGSDAGTTDVAKYLVRLSSAGSGSYYIQTGLGNYFQDIAQSTQVRTGSTQVAITVATIGSSSGHFYLKGSSIVLDANDYNSGQSLATVVGWGSSVPTTTGGNNDWAFYPVTLSDAEVETGTGETTVENYLSTGGAFRLRCRNNYSTSYEYAAMDSSNELVVAQKATSGSDAYNQIWILDVQSSGFTMRNVGTGLYMPTAPTSNRYGVRSATTYYGKYSATNNTARTTEYVTISYASDFNGQSCLHHQNSGHKLVQWNAASGSNDLASDWVLEPVTDFTDTQLKAQVNGALGYVNSVTSGKYYRIISDSYGRQMSESLSGNKVTTTAYDTDDYSGLWKVTYKSGNTIRFQNAVTDRYLTKLGSNLSTQYTTQTSQTSFTLADASTTWRYRFTITDSSPYGLHCSSSQSYNVVVWTTTADASNWIFEEVTPDATALADARAEYSEVNSIKTNASAYNTTLSTYFTDLSCSELKTEYRSYSDANLRSAMSSLPTTVQDMAVKVKNNAWTTYSGWDKTEKTFRVASYAPYSDAQRWTDIMGNGNLLGHLSNPTGISVRNGDVLTIYVDAVPSNQTVALEVVPGGQAYGPTFALNAGVNAYVADFDGSVFIYNSVDNTTNGGTPYTLMSTYSPVSVHIEGGRVNGYLNVATGDDADDWTKLKSNLMTEELFDVKTDNITFHLHKEDVLANSNDDFVDVMKFWNDLCIMERSYQGLEDYEGYCNNPITATTGTYDYMHASNYGVYFPHWSISSVFNLNNLKGSAGGLWAPAHEMGHLFQRPINMIGCIEISNNVFSNIAVYNQGHATSRTLSIKTTLENFSNGTFWCERNLWERTHMYWQLFQFFHIAGYNDDFYPELYKALRNSPLNHNANAFVPANEDYLKFYVTASQVSGYDLTEFFDAYGFFVLPEMTSHTLGTTTRDAYHVDDYANYYLYVTQAMIDNAKTQVRNMNLQPCNIIFIEDRITAPEATYEGHTSGEVKVNYGDEMGRIGECGETGQYTDYNTPITGTYAATVDASGNVTVSGGSGAVGFKVYDASGNLAYLANTHEFTLPASLLSGGYTIKAAAGDGSSVTLTTTEIETKLDEPFSTEDAPVYYYVRFYTGGAYLADQGLGSNVITAAKAITDAQQWAFIGTRDSFVMKSKLGNYLNYSGSNFSTSSTGVTLSMAESGNASAAAAGCFEIRRATSSSYMNQVGGTGTGKSLGEWTYGDPNNPVGFEKAVAELPEFSSGTDEHWYFLEFCNGGQTLRAATAGGNVTYGGLSMEDEQMWKFVGNQNNFQLVSKTGLYAVISGSGNSARLKSSTTADSNGFSLVTTGYVAYYPNWEIKWNGTNSGKVNLNRWGGGELSTFEIGMWSANDSNNPFYFIDPDDVDFPEYTVEGISDYTPENGQSLWYTQPSTATGVANEWMEYSLPIGNGQLGASLFGGVKKDQILFNEKTVWSGSTELSSGGGTGYGNYQYFGSVYAEEITDGRFTNSNSRPVSNYVRQLDLSTATGSVKYSDADGVEYTRQYIASRPDEVIAARYSASENGKINLRFTLTPGALRLANGTTLSPAVSYSNGEATFQQTLDLVTANARMKVIPTGGTMTTNSGNIEVRNADEVLLLFCGGTDFDLSSSTYISGTSALSSNISSKLTEAASKGWTQLYVRHLTDYQSLFNRVDFQLSGATNNVPTNELVDAYSNTAASSSTGGTLMLEKLYFDYGRYLEISSSRGVDVPSNLQGIWNATATPPWNSDIHANINVQMNYWPAEPTNLSETHMPFLNYIISMASDHTEWQSRAVRSGQTKGWTFYTENNIFGGGSPWSDNYTIANAWYATHLWQHYRYTLDREFLLRAFPAMWSCSQYWMERMVTASDGTYECPNEYSPEHGPSSENATAHSQQLVVELFQNTLDAASVLGSDAGLTAAQLSSLQDYLDHSDKGLAKETYTGNWGDPQNGVSSGTEILREWKYSAYSVGENNHRHQSHLMCLYPYNQVTPESEYFDAAVSSLRLRSDNSTGWSMGWRINLWARAQDGDHAHLLLHSALKHSTSYGTDQSRGGIYYNLYDSHAPFQIDGNFGACAGIAEMLMQSADGTIRLLPALPTVWADGSISGLKAVGNFTVGITWNEGVAKTATIKSNAGQPLVVKYPGIASASVSVNGAIVAVTANGDDEITIPIAENQTAVIDFEAQNVELTWVVRDADNAEVFRFGPTTHLQYSTVTALPDELLAYESRFVSYPEKETLSISADQSKEVSINYEWVGPFEFSTSESHHSYAWRFNDYSEAYIKAEASSPYSVTATRSGDAYSWFFEGDPFNGIVVRNESDPSKGLQATSLNTSGSGGPTLTATPTAFEIYNWNTDGTNNGKFTLKVPGDGNYYLNNYSGASHLQYWSSGQGDRGSQLAVEGYLNIPDGYFRFVNKANPTNWLCVKQDDYKISTVTGSDVAAAAQAAYADASTIFRLTEQSDGSYLISSRGTYVGTQTAYNSAVPTSTDVADAYSCNVIGNNDGTWSIRVGSSSNNFMHNNESYKNGAAGVGVVVWSVDEDASRWNIMPAEDFSIFMNKPSGDTKTYATTCLPFSYAMPAEATANIITVSDSKETAASQEIAGVVPAGTPVIFISESAATQVLLTISLDDPASGTESLVESNKLAGTFVTMDTPSGAYTFQAVGGIPGFYRYSGARLKAYRAYLPGDVAAQSKGLVLTFGDSTTGIDNVMATEDKNVIYDLQGRRVSTAGRGVYIVNGRKVLR